MLYSFFYTPAADHANTNDHTQLSNFMNNHDTDHSTIGGKPYLAVEQQNETEKKGSDFMLDFFGAVNY